MDNFKIMIRITIIIILVAIVIENFFKTMMKIIIITKIIILKIIDYLKCLLKEKVNTVEENKLKTKNKKNLIFRIIKTSSELSYICI